MHKLNLSSPKYKVTELSNIGQSQIWMVGFRWSHLGVSVGLVLTVAEKWT